MLKIKDNVDLKELEKFGFEKTYRNGEAYVKGFNDGSSVHKFILIRCEHKINGLSIGNARYLDFVHINSSFLSFNYCLNTLYDLIKANLVEKVGD